MPRHVFVSSPGNKMPRPLKKLRMQQQRGIGSSVRARQRGLPTQPCLLWKGGGTDGGAGLVSRGMGRMSSSLSSRGPASCSYYLV